MWKIVTRLLDDWDWESSCLPSCRWLLSPGTLYCAHTFAFVFHVFCTLTFFAFWGQMAPVSKRWVLARRARSGPLDPEENFELKEEHTPELRR